MTDHDHLHSYLRQPIRPLDEIAAEFRDRLANRREGETLSEDELRRTLAICERELEIRRQRPDS